VTLENSIIIGNSAKIELPLIEKRKGKINYYAGFSEVDSLYILVDKSYLTDRNEILKFPDGKRMLDQIKLIEDELIINQSKRLPSTFKDDLEKDKSEYVVELVDEAKYKGLGRYTKIVRSKNNDQKLCLVSVKLRDSKVIKVSKAHPLRQNRLTYVYKQINQNLSRIIFINCYGHKLYRYKKQLGLKSNGSYL